MFKMFAIICAVTVFDCRTMYEDPPRVFDSLDQCEAAATIKATETMELLTDEGEFTIEHFEVGCEKI